MRARITVISNDVEALERVARHLNDSVLELQRRKPDAIIAVQVVHDASLRLSRRLDLRDLPHARVLLEMPEHKSPVTFAGVEAAARYALNGGYFEMRWCNSRALDWRR